MATGQTLLNLMEVLNNELQLQTGEADVDRALIALNAAQDHFESIASQQVDLLGDSIGTVTTTANVEYTTYPSGLMRVDRMQYIDPVTNLPAWDLKPIYKTGGQVFNRFWPINLISTLAPGKPASYYTDGSKIYWSPLPKESYTVRWYGMQAAADITASGTFVYPDIVQLPLASFAVRLMKEGVGDEAASITDIADRTFSPVIRSMGNFRREGAMPFEYKYNHLA